MTSMFNRRSLISGAGMLLAGFAIPKTFDPPKTDRAVIWCVFIAGNPRCQEGFAAFERGQISARMAGFEVLDSMHNVRERSRFLARKETSLKYARKQERLVIVGPENSDVADIAEGIVAMWIEVA